MEIYKTYYIAKNGFRLCEGMNQYYRDKYPGEHYEQTMQKCFTVYGKKDESDFIADIIVRRSWEGLDDALTMFFRLADEYSDKGCTEITIPNIKLTRQLWKEMDC